MHGTKGAAGSEYLPVERVPAGRLPVERFYDSILRGARTLTDGLSVADFVCDVGCHTWEYLPALVRALPGARQIVGIEIEGHRLRPSLLYPTREKLARAHAREVSQRMGVAARVESGDFLKWDGVSGDRLAFLFGFPFLSSGPAHHWGLSQFTPFAEMLRHARRLARGRGFDVLSFHQGEWERELALEAYAQAFGMQTPLGCRMSPALWAGSGYPQRYEVSALSWTSSQC